MLTLSLPKKTKRACIACRRGKNKCDGEVQCSTCVRRDIECRYQDGEDDDVRMGGTSDGVSPQPSEQQDMGEHPEDSHKDMRDNGVPSTVEPTGSQSNQTPRINLQDITTNEQPRQAPTIPKSFGQGKIINWMSVQVRQDPVTPASVSSTEKAETKEERHNSELYTQEFFRSFHHRWTLIHRPTYEVTSSDTPLVASVRMIGAWLIGTVESKKVAWTIHEKCMIEILPKLVCMVG